MGAGSNCQLLICTGKKEYLKIKTMIAGLIRRVLAINTILQD